MTEKIKEHEANDKQNVEIERILELWWERYKGKESYEDFVKQFFAEGGQVYVPEGCPIDFWIFNSRIKPPEWLYNRVFNGKPPEEPEPQLPPQIIINNGE